MGEGKHLQIDCRLRVLKHQETEAGVRLVIGATHVCGLRMLSPGFFTDTDEEKGIHHRADRASVSSSCVTPAAQKDPRRHAS